MTSIINSLKNYRIALGMTVFAAVLAGALALSIAPAQAQWDGGFGDSGFDSYGDMGGGFDYTGGSWDSWGFGDSGSCDYGCDTYTGGSWDSYGFGDSGSCDYGCDSDGYGDQDYDSSNYDNENYDDQYNDQNYDSQGCSSCSSSSYGSGSSYAYSTPSYSYPYSKSSSYYIPPMYYYPPQQPVKPSKSNSTVNTCVNNSCNTEVITNTKIVGSFNQVVPEPYISYQPDYDVCINLPGLQATAPYGYVSHAGQCMPIPPSVQPPYVSLSSVPYTGLEMGPMATVLYWSFLVLWCALAAYLIAVKKVQNKLVSGLTAFLFPQTVAAGHSARVAHSAPRAAAPVAQADAIDPFIQSQIDRAK